MIFLIKLSEEPGVVRSTARSLERYRRGKRSAQKDERFQIRAYFLQLEREVKRFGGTGYNPPVAGM
jgi:hypothetical protein